MSRRGSGFMHRVTPWTPAEHAVIREHYPSGGAPACMEHLPGRTRRAVENRAAYLGITINDERRSELKGERGEASRAAKKGITTDDRALSAAFDRIDRARRSA